MSKVRVYVDGFNLYHAINNLGRPELKWLNLMQLSRGFLRDSEILDEVNFFTAVLRWNAEKYKRHVNYLRALRAVGVVVHEANFKRSNKHCHKYDRYCSFHEEKQTDVSIVIKLVSDALAGRMERAILVTADSDQIPTARFILKDTQVKLTLIYPPGRQQESRDLGQIVADKTELTAGRLGTAILPRTVMDESGRAAAQMPALYAGGG